MEQRLVFDLAPTAENGRNSEGAFLRAPDGRILFAYSHYNTAQYGDDAPCDIYMVTSSDEGESWSEPVCIARASDVGTSNIMSVSSMVLKDGKLCFFFLIKEHDDFHSSSIGRAVSSDGVNFTVSRCRMDMQKGYYVINNSRFIRLSDGRIATAAARHFMNCGYDGKPARFDSHGDLMGFISDDEGESFHRAGHHATLTLTSGFPSGVQEPGIIELPGGVIWMWARSNLGWQMQCYSLDGMKSFTPLEPSQFTSPCSPMSVISQGDGVMYNIYNPIPSYNGRTAGGWGRTPFVLRRSTDWGKTWGPLNTIEDDDERGYCYAGMFFTDDDSLLVGYCRGHKDDGCCLNRLGIMKIRLDSVK